MKTKLAHRRFLGLNILAGGKAPPQAYAIYEETYSDGSTSVHRGYSIHATPNSDMLNGTKKQKTWAAQEFRPNLFTTIHAAALLCNDISAACRQLDDTREQGEK